VKRLFDILLSVVSLLFFSVPLVLLALAIKLTSPGPVIYWSERIGLHSRKFRMPKFRTMRIDTPVVATHLLAEPDQYLTAIGGALRKTSLDELPQLWSILIGDMSFVGPRPALYNQEDLIALRKEMKVDTVPPGLTGWAQINGRDELSIADKVKLDAEYIAHPSLLIDIKIIGLTFLKVIRRDGVTH
jgi:O-antigen biosynthesis protein WbqP